MDGLLLIDKPQGITSHDVVDIARRKFNMRRIGHAGSLDPLATGLLIILVGKATSHFNRYMHFDKEYNATLRLGAATDSGDSQGKVTASNVSYAHISEPRVLEAFKGLEGRTENVPPMISALKHKGRPLYELARQGITVERKPRLVEIYRLTLLKYSPPDIEFEVKCSKGTYIRSLAEEIARRLDCVGHISQIRRISIGPYKVSEAKKIDNFDADDIRPCQS
ncbi:tRNA pseudouridine(55) synthase TruB [bacterium]|nr:MAG: tRNA pseudouridine(55) synthase TruB [bacterium]